MRALARLPLLLLARSSHTPSIRQSYPGYLSSPFLVPSELLCGMVKFSTVQFFGVAKRVVTDVFRRLKALACISLVMVRFLVYLLVGAPAAIRPLLIRLLYASFSASMSLLVGVTDSYCFSLLANFSMLSGEYHPVL